MKKRILPGLIACAAFFSAGLVPAYAQMPEQPADETQQQESQLSSEAQELYSGEESYDGTYVPEADSAKILEDEHNGPMTTGPLNSWQITDSGRYYYDANGLLHTGWLLHEDNWYFMNKTDGKMQTGLQKVGDLYYYLDPETGKMKTGLIDVPDVGLCYFSKDGARQTGWKLINEKWYYFHPFTTILQTGMQTINGEVYYLDPDTGMMQVGVVDIPECGKMYFNGDGARRTGWRKIDNNWYYFSKDDGTMQYGQQKIDGSWYLLDENSGVMYTGVLQKGDDLYNYKNTGELSLGWALIDGNWYYHNKETGVREYGAMNIDGKNYYLEANKQGKMYTGWYKDGFNWRLYGYSGDQQFGFATHNGQVYYMDPVTGYLRFQDFSLGNAAYYLDENGAVRRSVISNVNYLMQTDPRWAMDIVHGYPIGGTGCVPTVLTMIYNYWNNANMLPPESCLMLGKEDLFNGTGGAGCGDDAVIYFSNYHGFKCEAITTLQQMENALKAGKMIAGAMDGGIFTSPGSSHEILIYGYENGMTNVLDPYFTSHNGSYRTDVVWGQRSAERFNIAHGGPIFAISKP